MKSRVSLVVAFIALSGLMADEKEDPLKKLEGKWLVKSIVTSGVDRSDKLGKDDYVTIEKGKFTSVHGGRKIFSADVKVDASKNPAQIDMKILDGFDKGENVAGIYKLNGKKLTLAFGETGRPDKFESKADSGVRLMELELSK